LNIVGRRAASFWHISARKMIQHFFSGAQNLETEQKNVPMISTAGDLMRQFFFLCLKSKMFFFNKNYN